MRHIDRLEFIKITYFEGHNMCFVCEFLGKFCKFSKQVCDILQYLLKYVSMNKPITLCYVHD